MSSLVEVRIGKFIQNREADLTLVPNQWHEKQPHSTEELGSTEERLVRKQKS